MSLLNRLHPWRIFKRDEMQFWLQIKGWSSMTLVFEGEVLSLSRMVIPGAVAGGGRYVAVAAGRALWFAEAGTDDGAICCILRLKHKLLLGVWIWVV